MQTPTVVVNNDFSRLKTGSIWGILNNQIRIQICHKSAETHSPLLKKLWEIKI